MSDDARENAEILALLDRLDDAHAAKDAAAIAACFAPDAAIYSLAPPLGETGLDRAGLQDWLDSWTGPIRIDRAETAVSRCDDAATVWGFNRMRGTKTDGETVDLWFRATAVLRRTTAGWRIVHEHASVPFLMDGSARAALNLKP